jgi:hypothetical protein
LFNLGFIGGTIQTFWQKRRNGAFVVKRALSAGDGILLAAARAAA